MATKNQGIELFSIVISYGTTQTHSQTLNTPSCDQPKDPKNKKHKEENHLFPSYRKNWTLIA